jgi:hypothetical protein
MHALLLVYGATADDIANSLESYAKMIRAGVTRVSDDDRCFVRQGERDGCAEEADARRMHGVYQAEGYELDPIALFRDPEHAARFAGGKPIYDGNDEPNTDLCVMRTDVLMSAWNCIDQGDDPHASGAP